MLKTEIVVATNFSYCTTVPDFVDSVTPREVFSNSTPYSQPTASLTDRLCTCLSLVTRCM